MVFGLKIISEEKFDDMQHEIKKLRRDRNAAILKVEEVQITSKKNYDRIYSKLNQVKKYVKEANPMSRFSSHSEKILSKLELSKK